VRSLIVWVNCIQVTNYGGGGRGRGGRIMGMLCGKKPGAIFRKSEMVFWG